MQKRDFQKLLDKNLSGKATEFEKQVLEAYFDRLSIPGDPFASPDEEEAIKAEILYAVKRRIHGAPVVSITKRPWLLIAAAAVFAGLLAAGYFWYMGQPKEIGGQEMLSKKGADILPGKDGAILQLANGKSILLDTIQNGTVIIEENLRITKEDGNIRYEPATGSSAELAKLTNTVSTPISRKWSLQLPDGSRVWLNSESSITYPLVFNDQERSVQLSGEAYFDVVHNARAPFKVQAGSLWVEDLGTAFNLNAYANEARKQVTLVTGLVRVKSSPTDAANAIDLVPGQQAELSTNGKLGLKDRVNVEDVVAWKNGLFKFSEGTIDEVMRAAARWYGITVSYEGVIKDHFVLNLSRDLPLSALLEILESTGRVRFEVSGNRVKVIAVPMQK